MSKEGICITVNLSLLPEYADAVCDELAIMVQDTRNFPGFVDVEIARRADDPTKLIFVEHWSDTAAYEKYAAWRTEHGDMEALVAKMSSPPEISFWPTLVVKAGGPTQA